MSHVQRCKPWSLALHSQSRKGSSPKAMTLLEDWGCPGNRLAPAYSSILISNKEPWVTLDVVGKKINFLVDTGATYSVFISYTGPLSFSSINIMEVEEKSHTCFYTPHHLLIWGQWFKHFFIIFLQCPILLLEWDLLARLGGILKFQEVPVKISKIMLTNKES